MADSPLMPYSPAGANMQYPTATERGYMQQVTLDAVKDASQKALDHPFFLKLRHGNCQPTMEQVELVDMFAPVTTLPTPTAQGVEPGDITDTPNEQGQTTKTSSATNNRSLNHNYIQLLDDTFSVSEAAEIIARMGGIGGGITSEVQRDISRKSLYLFIRGEFAMLSYQAGVRDLMDKSTAGKFAGAFRLLNTVPTNWADTTLGVTANVNIQSDGKGGVTSFVPTSVTDVTEAIMHTAVQQCWKNGSSMALDAYIPPDYHEFVTENYKGRPNVRVTVPEKDAALNMEFEVYTAVSGVKLKLIPHRRMSPYGILIADHEQWAKRVFQGFEVRRYIEKTRNKRGYMQMSWTLTPGVILASAAFYVPGSLPGS